MKGFNFEIENGKLCNVFYKSGLTDLCAIVDKSSSLIHYGSKDQVVSRLTYIKNGFIKMGYRDLAKDLVLIEISKLDLTLEEQCKFINYMMNISCNGYLIDRYLNGPIQDMKIWLNEME